MGQDRKVVTDFLEKMREKYRENDLHNFDNFAPEIYSVWWWQIADAVGIDQKHVSEFLSKLCEKYRQNDSHNFDNFDLGVQKIQSSRWQALAGIPEAEHVQTTGRVRIESWRVQGGI